MFEKTYESNNGANDPRPTPPERPLAPALEATLIEAFATAWDASHGLCEGEVKVLYDDHVLTIIIEEAFSPAEMRLIQDAGGHTLLQSYLERLSMHMMPELTEQVEEILSCSVASALKSVDVKQGFVLFLFKLAA